MPQLELVLRDDDGNVIGVQKIHLDVQSGSLHDIEGAVEFAKQIALPNIEKSLLKEQQERLREEKRGS